MASKLAQQAPGTYDLLQSHKHLLRFPLFFFFFFFASFSLVFACFLLQYHINILVRLFESFFFNPGSGLAKCTYVHARTAVEQHAEKSVGDYLLAWNVC